MQEFWSDHHIASQYLGFQRFKTIESYINICSDEEQPTGTSPWFWKVQLGVDQLREQCKQILIPSSHICVDESSIKFFGRKKDKYKLPHKPAKEGFVCYALTSYGGLIHDFCMSSSQDRLEGIGEGYTIDLTTRNLRKRKRGTNSTTADVVSLPPLKSMVFMLCERVTAGYRRFQHICFLDNLFVDVKLARALLTIDIGICGTTRKNTPGIPPILLAIQHRFSRLLPNNRAVSCIVDGLVNITTWKDEHRQNTVTAISTVHRPTDRQQVLRKSKPLHATRARPNGYQLVWVSQPRMFTDYTNNMGSTDDFNHMRAMSSVRRPSQPKWTKKYLEWMTDICHINAYLIWKRNPANQRRDHREREFFINELIHGLIHSVEKVHAPNLRSKRSFCAWRGCQPQGGLIRQPLEEVRNLATRVRRMKTRAYCEDCGIYLCITKSCWDEYHGYHRLQCRPEEWLAG